MSTDVVGLTALVFLLGVRHGFDPDHIVAIDGLTRSGTDGEIRRWSGVFFSLGHGIVVTLVGAVVAILAADWQAPLWLEQLGAWISISVLLALGSANLMMVFRTPAAGAVPLVGLRGQWLTAKLGGASHPVFIASIGAAFALSFDTISHALLFSLTGASIAGWLFAMVLGLVFTLGMVLIDGLNGWWVAKLRASRVLSVVIALLCLALAAAGLARYAPPKEAVSVAATLLVLAAYLITLRRAPRGI